MIREDDRSRGTKTPLPPNPPPSRNKETWRPRLFTGLTGEALKLGVATGLSQVLTGAVLLAGARALPPSSYAGAISALAILTFLSTVSDLGGTQKAIRSLSAGQSTLPAYLQASRIRWFVALCSTGGLSLVLSATNVYPGTTLVAAMAAAVAALAAQQLQAPLRARHEIAKVSATLLLDKTIGLTSAFALLFLVRPEPWGVPAALAIGSTSSMLLSIRFLGPDSKSIISRPTTMESGVSRAFAATGLALNAQALDLPLIQFAGGSSLSAPYAAVTRWTNPMGLLATVYCQAAYPHMAAARSHHDAFSQVKRSSWLPLMGLLFALAVAAAAPAITPYLLGDRYPGADKVLSLLAIATALGIINQPLAIFLQARGRERIVALLLNAAVALQLITVALLASRQLLLAPSLALCGSQSLLLVSLSIQIVATLRTEGGQQP